MMAVMHAAALQIDLRLRDVHSLKSKRHLLKRLSSNVRKAYPVAFAEVDHQDAWQRSTVGISIVSPHAAQLRMAVHNVQRFLDDFDGVEVLNVEISHLEEPGA